MSGARGTPKVRLVVGARLAVGARSAAATACAAAFLGGCAPAPPPGQRPTAVGGNASVAGVASEPGKPAASKTLPDSEWTGSLRQDQISIRLEASDLRIEVTPLADWVLEAAAPDARRRLGRVAETYGSALARRTGDDGQALFLVSFSSDRPATEFEPFDLHLLSRGLRERPRAVEPVSPGWGSRRLEQRSTASAVYAYSGSVDLSRGLTVVYRDAEDSSWTRILAAVEAERARAPPPQAEVRQL